MVKNIKLFHNIWFRYIPGSAAQQNEHAWNKLIDDTYSIVKDLPIPDRPANPKYFAVILEPRSHPHLEYVIRNALWFLGPDWGLQVFHGNKNREFVQKIVADWPNAILTPLGVDDLTPRQYNKIKASSKLWKTVKGEQVIWFEPDAIMFRSGIEEFLEFDYVGAPWAYGIRGMLGRITAIIRNNYRTTNMIKTLSKVVDFICQAKQRKIFRGYAWNQKSAVGNGGFSLRSVSKMIECCEHYEHRFPNNDAWHEDIFFSKNLPSIGGKIAPVKMSGQFCVEQNGTWVEGTLPLATHKPYLNLTSHDFNALMKQLHYETQKGG